MDAFRILRGGARHAHHDRPCNTEGTRRSNKQDDRREEPTAADPVTTGPHHATSVKPMIGGASPRSGTAGAIRHHIGSRQPETPPPSVGCRRAAQRGNPTAVTLQKRPSGSTHPNGMRPSFTGGRPPRRASTHRHEGGS